LPKEDPEVSETISHVLEREGIRIETGARVQRLSRQGNKKVAEARQGEQTLRIEADEVLLALGRAPNVEGLNLEAARVAYDQHGIQTNVYLQTTAANISAIGDVIGGHLFTHIAAYQAGVAVRNLLVPIGRKKVNYTVLPWVTFTDPEAARVGLTEDEALQQGQRFRVIRFPWHAIDRAQTDGSLDGFIKLIVSEKSDTILGAHLVGSRAGELLGELTLAMQHHLSSQDILATIHAYPTLSTGVQQTAFEAYLKSAALSSARRIIRPLLSWRG
jgi:pyruvate/2-oxoglutarate dehydrogenase complex dihydrolipoamide dehydrogenase (E3) component